MDKIHYKNINLGGSRPELGGLRPELGGFNPPKPPSILTLGRAKLILIASYVTHEILTGE